MRDGFAPVPVLRAPYFEREVLGGEMLDRLGGALFADADAGGGPARPLAQELARTATARELRLDAAVRRARATSRSRRSALELVVRVGGAKRMIVLPSAMAALRPVSATFTDRALVVSFEPAAETVAAVPASATRSRPAGHIDAAHAAADRLVREAQARAEAADKAFRERLADVPSAAGTSAPSTGRRTRAERAAAASCACSRRCATSCRPS